MSSAYNNQADLINKVLSFLGEKNLVDPQNDTSCLAIQMRDLLEVAKTDVIAYKPWKMVTAKELVDVTFIEEGKYAGYSHVAQVQCIGTTPTENADVYVDCVMGHNGDQLQWTVVRSKDEDNFYDILIHGQDYDQVLVSFVDPTLTVGDGWANNTIPLYLRSALFYRLALLAMEAITGRGIEDGTYVKIDKLFETAISQAIKIDDNMQSPTPILSIDDCDCINIKKSTCFTGAGQRYATQEEHDALEDRVEILETAAGLLTFDQEDEPIAGEDGVPEDIPVGSLWFERTGSITNSILRWTGGGWQLVDIADPIIRQGTVLPVPGVGGYNNPIPTGSLFIDESDRYKLYYYNGTAWVWTLIQDDTNAILNLDFDIEQLEFAMVAAEADIDNLENEVLALDGDVIALENDIQDLEMEDVALQTAIDDVADDVNAAEADINQLETETTTLFAENDAQDLIITDHETRIALLEAAPPGIETYDQATAPTGTIQTGSIWIERTGTTTNSIYRWTGGGWQLVDYADALIRKGTVLPSAGVGGQNNPITAGSLFILDPDEQLHYHDGTNWVPTQIRDYSSFITALQAFDATQTLINNALSNEDLAQQAQITGNDTDIAALVAEQLVQDADISALEAEQIVQNTDITALQTQVASVQAQVTANDGDISANIGNIAGNAAGISANDTDITALQAADTSQDALIADHEARIVTLEAYKTQREPANRAVFESRMSWTNYFAPVAPAYFTFPAADHRVLQGGITLNAAEQIITLPRAGLYTVDFWMDVRLADIAAKDTADGRTYLLLRCPDEATGKVYYSYSHTLTYLRNTVGSPIGFSLTYIAQTPGERLYLRYWARATSQIEFRGKHATNANIDYGSIRIAEV